MKKWIVYVLTAALILAAAGCGQRSGGASQGAAASPSSTASSQAPADTPKLEDWLVKGPKYPDPIPEDDKEAFQAVKADNPLDAEYLAAMQGFSFRFSSQMLTGETGNACYSPLSLYMALTTAATGAKNQTRAELLAQLGLLGRDNDYLSWQTGNLFRRLYTEREQSALLLANSLWMKQNALFDELFTENAARHFYASLYRVDFSNPATSGLMGEWAEKQTKGLISPEVKLQKDEILFLFNTLYLKDNWETGFTASAVSEGVFTNSDGQEVARDFVNGTVPVSGYKTGDGYTAASLRLKSLGRVTFVLPDQDQEMDALLANPDTLAAMFFPKDAQSGRVTISFPKFSFDTETDLKEPLQKLGMLLSLEPGADFSGISPEDIFISQVNQQTRVEFNENGVEAAAFTSIGFQPTAMPPDQPFELTLDRPFLFSITGNDGVILFIGIVNQG